MNRMKLRYLLSALLATALIVCGVICILLSYGEADLYASIAVAAELEEFEREQSDTAYYSVGETTPHAVLVNKWTIEPYISNFEYKSYEKIEGVAEHGDVKFSVFSGEDSHPVNDILTDFMLIEETVSDEVKGAFNALNVGTYILKASAQADGYEPLNKSVEFAVTRLNNKWAAGATPQIAGWVYGDSPKQIYRQPNPLAGKETYTLEGYNIKGVETYDTLEAFNERIGRIGADALGQKDCYHDYKTTVSVDETDNYTGLYIEITFRVKRQLEYPNDYDGAGFYIKSFPFGTLYNKIDWNMITPSEAEITRAVFSAIDADGNTVAQHDVLLKDGADPNKPSQKSKKAFIAKLSLLEAGTYTVRADVFEGETYGACSSEITLEIMRVALPGAYSGAKVSAWEKEPYINISDGQSGDAVWEYGKIAGIPTAQPRACARYYVNYETLGVTSNHIDLSGELIKTYYKRVTGADGQETKGEKLGVDIGGSTANMPKAVGKYYVEFGIRENKNYYLPDEEIRLLPFEITLATDTTFTTSPFAVGWTWGSFDKKVNLFGAIPTKGGEVDFTVKKNNVAVKGLENFRVDAQNVIIDENGLSDKLNKLDSGVYTLEVHVASAGNYKAFTAETVFRVSQAANSWTVSPNIARWAQYYFKAEENTPQADAKYGDVVIEVRKKDNNEIYYKFANGSASITNLENALAGWYTLAVTVEETTNYSGLSYNIEFQVFSESADMPRNYWVVIPTIESWIAGNVPSAPVYESLRGDVQITYCKAELKDGKYVAVGSVFTEQPKEPGKYFMYARIRHEILPQDELLKHDVIFDIFERVNEWTVTPSIQSYTLGDGPSTPIAEVLYTDNCIIDFKYRLRHGDDTMSELPRVPGEYVMIVTATAKYCAPLTAEVGFTVTLSQNSWVNAPTIKDWSEEETASLPIGEAAVGSEYIVYTYARLDKPNEILSDKPTSEGEYIMYATLDIYGYETLTAQWTFTVVSAYDRTLVTFDIVLGIVCCILTVVLITFAIKRSRQNG